MTPAENFGRAFMDVCPKVLSGELDFDIAKSPRDSGITPVDDLPSYLSSFPTTNWFSFDASPHNVFISKDNYEGPTRCRIILANNMNGSSANLFLAGRLQNAGAKAVEIMTLDTKRNLRSSILYLDTGDDVVMYLIQSLPRTINAGRGQQATATSIIYPRAEAAKIFKGIN